MNKNFIKLIFVVILLLINIKLVSPDNNDTNITIQSNVNNTNITLQINHTLVNNTNFTLQSEINSSDINITLQVKNNQSEDNNLQENISAIEVTPILETKIEPIKLEPKSSYIKEDYATLKSNSCRNRKCVTEYNLYYYSEQAISDSSKDFPKINWENSLLPKSFEISILRKVKKTEPVYKTECNPTYKDLGNGTKIIDNPNCRSISRGTKTYIDYQKVNNIENGEYVLKISGELYPGQKVDNILSFMNYSYPEYAVWADTEWITKDYWEWRNSTRTNISMSPNGTIELLANYNENFITTRVWLMNISDYVSGTQINVFPVFDGEYIWMLINNYRSNGQAGLIPYYWNGTQAYNNRCYLNQTINQYALMGGSFVNPINSNNFLITANYNYNSSFIINLTDCTYMTNTHYLTVNALPYYNGYTQFVLANTSTIFSSSGYGGYYEYNITVSNYTMNISQYYTNFSFIDTFSSSYTGANLVYLEEESGNLWFTNGSKKKCR